MALLQDQNKLEYHAPISFHEKISGLIYSCVEYDMDIEEHPLASKFPRTSNEATIYSDLDKLADLARRSGGPKCLDDILNSDEPQFSLHVVSFQDAPLVFLSWLHIFMDAMAMYDVLNAWILVLNGREASVPPIFNF